MPILLIYVFNDALSSTNNVLKKGRIISTRNNYGDTHYDNNTTRVSQ